MLKKFGSFIREERLLLGLNQKQLADLSGVSRNYISDVERGKRNISLINILRVFDALDIEIILNKQNNTILKLQNK